MWMGFLQRLLIVHHYHRDIDIVPYRSTKDKVLHMLNGNVGNYVDKPIIIEPADYEKFKDIIVNQDITLDPRDVTRTNIEEDYDINFKTDDLS